MTTVDRHLRELLDLARKIRTAVAHLPSDPQYAEARLRKISHDIESEVAAIERSIKRDS